MVLLEIHGGSHCIPNPNLCFYQLIEGGLLNLDITKKLTECIIFYTFNQINQQNEHP